MIDYSQYKHVTPDFVAELKAHRIFVKPPKNRKRSGKKLPIYSCKDASKFLGKSESWLSSNRRGETPCKKIPFEKIYLPEVKKTRIFYKPKDLQNALKELKK